VRARTFAPRTSMDPPPPPDDADAAADPDTDALGGASVSSRTRFPSTYRAAAADVFEAARAGDTARVCALVDARPELVDAADASNSTPLFYACLCGHLPTVRALLARGAGCEEATFEGERAVYGALTDDIRGALGAARAAARARGGPLSRHLFFLLESGRWADLTLVVRADGTRLAVHRAVLAARCAPLAAKLAGRWAARDVVELVDARLDGAALRAVVRFLYTERIVVPRARLAAALAIARSLRLRALAAALEAAAAGAAAGGERRGRAAADDAPVALSLAPPAARAGDVPARPSGRGDSLVGDFYHHLLLGGVVPRGAAAFADGVAGGGGDGGGGDGDGDGDGDGGGGGDSGSDGGAPAPAIPHDLEFVADGGVVFRAHAALVAGRSAFVDTLLSFNGAAAPSRAAPRRVALLETGAGALAAVLAWLYADACPPPGGVGEALEAVEAAALLLVREGLLSLLSGAAARALAEGGAAAAAAALPPLWRAAELHGLLKLSAACAAAAAAPGVLPALLASRDFAALVADDARAVVARQEFDSVPVLDALKAALRAAGADAPPDALAAVEAFAAGLGLKTRR